MRLPAPMLRRLGYACLCQSEKKCSPKGTILRNASPERLRELIRVNLDNLSTVLRFNVDHDVKLFRLSSDLIPFGSHTVNQIHWWDEFSETLTRLGAYIRNNDLRVSMHPGQYTVLTSLDPGIVDSAVRDLAYHTRLLDALGVDTTHKVIIHVGGAYGDKRAAMDRWVAQVHALTENVRARLIVENDERLFGAEDVLSVSAEAGVAAIFDVFHHRVYTGGDDTGLADLLRRTFTSWQPERDGIPKIHYSSQGVGKRPGAHAEYVEATEFGHFLTLAPPELSFDCMIEAKAKELAVFRLRERLSLAA